MAQTQGASQAEKKKKPPPMLFIIPPKRAPPPPKSPGSPMKLSCAAYYAKRAISIYEILSPVDTVMNYYVPMSLRVPSMSFADLASMAANCKYEHPGANNQSANPFSVLSGSGNNSGGGGGFAKAGGGFGTNSYSLNPDVIVKDLTEERPQWILSAYGPGRDAPEQLWGGPIEQSFEEMRLHFEMAAAAGNPQGAMNDIQALQAQAQQKIQTAVSNPQAAINYIMQAANQHPNRHDFARSAAPRTGEFEAGKRPNGFAAAQPSNGFSSGTTSGNPFGQPANPGQSSNPFSTGVSTAFGQPSSLGQPSAFGQPSALGQGSALGGGGGFGQPSALGQKPGPFGQPSALGGVGGFGQPSSLGGGGGFGQPSALGQAAGTGFGQTSALGQKPNPFGTPAFGQPAQPAQGGGGGFGQPSQLGAKPNPFANGGSASSASPFGAFAANSNNTSNAPNGSPFGTLASANNSVSPFTQNNQQAAPTPFGQPQQPPTAEISMDSGPTPTSNSFAAANNANAPANPFGQPSQPAANPFGQPAQPAANPFAQASSSANPFGAPASQPAAGTTIAGGAGPANPYGPNATRQHPPYPGSKGMNNQLQMWKGKPVAYKEIDEKPTPVIQNFDNSFTKIWFPDGPPAYYKDTEPEREYTDADKAAWQKFASTGKFELAANGGGGMPEAAPMREFCTWDF